LVKISSSSWKLLAGAGGALGLGLVSRWLYPPVETRLHAVNESGIVEASPAGLARNAGVPLDVYALASAMQSEEGSDRGRLAVGRAVWNAVRGRRERLVRKLIPSGRLGEQTRNPYAATSKPPTARTLELALAVIAGRVPDFVAGATQWDAPEAQDRLHQLFLADPSRYPKYRWSSADVAAKRVKGGAREVRVDGVPATRFWTYA
jgi:hypothetical protein